MGLRLTDNIWCLGNHLFHFFVVGQKQSVIVECGVSGAVANLRRQWPQLHPGLRSPNCWPCMPILITSVVFPTCWNSFPKAR